MFLESLGQMIFIIKSSHISDGLVPLFDDFFSRDFYVGFKLLSSYWKIPLPDSAYNPVWEYADKHHLPILLHTWNDSYNSPVMLTEIIKKIFQRDIFIRTFRRRNSR